MSISSTVALLVRRALQLFCSRRTQTQTHHQLALNLAVNLALTISCLACVSSCSRGALEPTPPPPPVEVDHFIEIQGRFDSSITFGEQ